MKMMLLMPFTILCLHIYAQNFEQSIVNTSHQHYSYDEMLEDLALLRNKYVDYITYELRDSSTQGRALPVIYFGNQKALHHVMIQATIHAREYMASQLVMALLEFYAGLCNNGENYQGSSVRNLFNNVCLVIMPMVNPDGVEIAQQGYSGNLTEDVKQWVKNMTGIGIPHHQIKANARGVDLNRNFSNGFGKGNIVNQQKHYYYYPGPEPYSEPESRLMLKISKEFDYDCFLNYHTSGNIVYYGCMNARNSVNVAASRLAQLIKRHTGYPCYGPKSASISGTWADEVEILYQRPSATIELGTTNPVPISQFNQIYAKNQWIWAELALALINGNF